MIPEEEKIQIIDRMKAAILPEIKDLIAQAKHEAKEESLLLLPEICGNMMTNFATLRENNQKFWDAHPEFVKHKDAAKSVIEMTEGKNPLLSHKEILNKAVPEIKKRIDTIKKLDLDTVSANPDRKFERFESIDSPSDKNPHGII